MDKKFVKGAVAVDILGISQQTLRKYADDGLIESKRTPGGHRIYNIKDYLNKNSEDKSDKFICYCRVSTYGQSDDLNKQIEYMKNKYPNHEVIRDIGSGINFKRKGIQQIIDYAIKGLLRELVVSYKDRLCRIGYDLLEYILVQYSDTKIIIDEQHSEESVNEEIAKDILEIITVYSAKIHGMRRYKI